MTVSALTVLGVHGVRNHQPGLTPDQAGTRLAGWWQDGLVKGLSRNAIDEIPPLATEVAYYAHHLNRSTAQGDEDPALLPEPLQQQIIDWTRLLGVPDDTAQGWLTAPARAAVSWTASRYGLDRRPLSILTNALFREVDRYFTDPEARQSVRGEVVDALVRTRPRVVIAHSLGSVVAYEALWSPAATGLAPLDLLITLGSPLAVPGIVFDRLAEHPGPRGIPPGVRRWVNLADPGDVIAVPKGGVARVFEGVTDLPGKQIGLFSYHQVTKYLAAESVAESLRSVV
ncbi:hypothetical protein ABH935_005721 [Catenulispora sp. GAS73]|uniref:hypothetical protein n=1 Tax=Catenulispora sp. GAS73 TaxID=3156269 RepID=UPI0035177E9B